MSHMSSEDSMAAENMIYNIYIPDTVAGHACDEEKTRLSATFWKENSKYFVVYLNNTPFC